MHHDPEPKVGGDLPGKDADEIRVAVGHPHLAHANAEAGADGSELREVAIDAKGKRRTAECWEALEDGADRWGFSIEADQVMTREVLQRCGRPAPFEVAAMGVQPQRDRWQALGNERFLRRLDHAHGDVGLAPQQVVHDV